MKISRVLTLFILFCGLAASALAAGDPQDAEGSRDPALFNRMPHYHIYAYENKEFDRHEFETSPSKTESVEGSYNRVIYYPDDSIGGKLPSPVQIVRNYVNAVKAVGGKLLYEYEDGGSEIADMKVAKDGAETWVRVQAAPNGIYEVNIIEKQVMEQAVKADANSLLSGIRASGKAAVYGIYFGTGSTVIKPGSEAALREIAKLLRLDPSLRLYVVGHTDNVGGYVANWKLSSGRAAAVVKALTGEYGIAPKRLKPAGVGPLCPADTNLTDAGRAKNRRVELVAM